MVLISCIWYIQCKIETPNKKLKERSLLKLFLLIMEMLKQSTFYFNYFNWVNKVKDFKRFFWGVSRVTLQILFWAKHRVWKSNLKTKLKIFPLPGFEPGILMSNLPMCYSGTCSDGTNKKFLSIMNVD